MCVASLFGRWVLVVLLAVVWAPAPSQADRPVRTSKLTIVTRSGAHVFHVEEALTKAQRERGLMRRRALPRNGGMIFAFPVTRAVAFWMKDTLIPLDMVFVRADGTIAGIRANARPLSERPVASPEPVRFVIEIRGGRAAEIGAAKGDRVSNRLIARPPAQ